MRIQSILMLFSLLALVFFSCDNPVSDNPGSSTVANEVTTSYLSDSLLRDLVGDSARIVGTITVASGSTIVRSGICWNTSGAPTISDNHLDSLISISATSYYRTLAGLTPNTQYYVRFYAEIDNAIVYGNTISFNSGRIMGTSVCGGQVFYNDGMGGGYVISEVLSSSQAWSNVTNASAVGSARPTWGTGYGNTLTINSQSGHTSSAAKVCLDHNTTGIQWYLPSEEELAYALSILNLSGVYWCSSEDTPLTAREVSQAGAQSKSKSTLNQVRAIRIFP